MVNLPELKIEVSPGQGLNLLALDLLKRLFPDDGLIPPAIAARAQQIANDLQRDLHHDRDIRRASKSEYELWIEQMFRSVLDGVRREDLIREFLNDLQRFIDEAKSEDLFAIVLAEIPFDEASTLPSSGYRLLGSCGRVHQQHWKNFARRVRDEGGNPFCHTLFREDEGLELIFARYWPDYRGEIDDLARESHQKAAKSSFRGFWFSTVNLHSIDPYQPHRVLLVAYQNFGDYDVPKPSRGAAMESPVLFFLYIAYRAADHAVLNLHGEVAEQREGLIKSLAPGVLAHELAGKLLPLAAC